MDKELVITLLVGGLITILFTIAVAYFVKMTREA